MGAERGSYICGAGTQYKAEATNRREILFRLTASKVSVSRGGEGHGSR